MELVEGLPLAIVIDIIKHFNFEQEAILIGGQALAFWANYYHPPIPDNLKSYISTDLDFLADQTVAVLAADRLSGTLYLPNLDDATPQSGKIFLEQWQQAANIEIDFLYTVVGLNTIDIEKKAIRVSLWGVILNVMHPLHCLESRLYNLKLLSSKRTAKGISQAILAVSIMVNYLLDQLQQNNDRVCFNMIERIHYLSIKDVGLQLYQDYGIDLLQAIPASQMIQHPEFLEQRWPQMYEQTKQKRQAYKIMRMRTQKPNINSNPRL